MQKISPKILLRTVFVRGSYVLVSGMRLLFFVVVVVVFKQLIKRNIQNISNLALKTGV